MVMRFPGEIPYMTFTGPDCKIKMQIFMCDHHFKNFVHNFWKVQPPRDHVFYVTFPSNWKLQDIFQLFKIYGKHMIEAVRIQTI